MLCGCDPNAKPGADDAGGKNGKDAKDPAADPWMKLSSLNAPKHGKIDADADLSAEDLHAKHVTKIKEMQAKAVKEQDEAIKKAEKKNKKDDNKDKKDVKDDPMSGRAIASGGRELLQLQPPKELRDKKQPVYINKSDGNLSNNKNTIELPGNTKTKQRTGPNTFSNGDDNGGKAIESNGVAVANRAMPRQKSLVDPVKLAGTGTVQIDPPQKLKDKEKDKDKEKNKMRMSSRGMIRTEDTDQVLDAFGKLQGQRKPDFKRSPAEHHDTVSNKVSQVLALSRLKSAAREREDAGVGPEDKTDAKAEVVNLNGLAAANGLANADKTAAAPGAPQNVTARPADVETEKPVTEEEMRVFNEERYRTGLKAIDVYKRGEAFQRAALEKREDAIPYLVDELRKNNHWASYAAVALGTIAEANKARAPAVENDLIEGLGSREYAVRQACAQALALIKSKRAIAPISEILKTEKNYQTRCVLVGALGGIGDKQALPVLKAKLEQADEIPFVRCHAALALTRFGDPAGRKYLLQMLDSPEPSLQVVGLMGLSQLNDPNVAGYINSALDSRYDEVWTTAIYLFPRLGPAAALPVLRARLEAPQEVMRRRAALAMGFLGSDEGLPYIDRACKAGSEQERAMGCALLGVLQRHERAPLLIEKLQDPHSSVRQTAAVALVRLNAVEAIPAMTECARGTRLVQELPPGYGGGGGGTDMNERLIMLTCVRMLRGEKDELVISTMPNMKDNNWPEVDRLLAGQQVELAKMFQLIDVVIENKVAIGALLKGPDGREILYREGETVAAGFKLKEIGAPTVNPNSKDGTKFPAYAVLMRGEERVMLAVGRAAEYENGKQKGR